MIFLHYLWDRKLVLLIALSLSIPLGGLMFLYGLSLSQAGYCLLVTALIGLGLFLVPDFIRYRREVLRLTAMKRLSQDGLLEQVVPSGGLHRRLLMESVELLRARAQALEQEAASRQEDLLDYYTLWVHQVKTPLSAMRLIVQSSQPDGAAGELGQELFKIERYMEMLLGYLRMQSMQADLRLESRPVRPIAAKAVKKFAAQFIYKKLRVQLEDFPNRVVTDEKWLLLVLEQLISNAVKYTSSGEIRISMDEQNVLTVSDTGIGIDPADLPRVCERGFTGRNGRLDTTSTGLGLYLVKEILDRLQNRMEIRSVPGEGTQVLLDLDRPKGVGE